MGSPFTCVCSADLSQARHSKQQLMVDLNSWVYLRTSKLQAFTLPDCLTLTRSPQHYAHLVSSSLSHRAITVGPGRLGRKSGQFLLCHCSWASATKVSGCPWHSSPSISLISRIFMHFQDLSSSQGLHPHSGGASSFLEPIQSVCRSTTRNQPPNWWSCLMSLYE